MIYTLTFNPALDYTTQVENFKIGKINRTKTGKKKYFNKSRIVK